MHVYLLYMLRFPVSLKLELLIAFEKVLLTCNLGNSLRMCLNIILLKWVLNDLMG